MVGCDRDPCSNFYRTVGRAVSSTCECFVTSAVTIRPTVRRSNYSDYRDVRCEGVAGPVVNVFAWSGGRKGPTLEARDQTLTTTLPI